MVPGNLVVQMPPDSFDRIGLWSILGQVVKRHPRMLLQIVLHGPAGVEAGIVTNDMDASITAKDAAEVIEVFQEGCTISAFRPSRHQTAGVPRQGAKEMLLLIGAGCLDGGLLASGHPHGTDLGIGADLGFVLEESDFVIRQRVHQTLDFQDFGIVVGVFRSEDGTRPTPDYLAVMQIATHGFATDVHLIFAGQQEHQRGAGPSAAEIAKVKRCVGLDPSDDTGHPPIEGDRGGQRSNAVPALLLVSSFPSRDGGGAAIQNRGNVVPGMPIRQQEKSVPPQTLRGGGRVVKRAKKSLAFGSGNAKIAIHGLLACSGLGRTSQHNDKPVFLQDRFSFTFGEVGSYLAQKVGGLEKLRRGLEVLPEFQR